MRPRLFRTLSLLCLLPSLLLMSMTASAQFEKPRNRLQLPMSTPVTVRVSLPQTQLEASSSPGVSSATGGMVAAAIADMRMDRHLTPQLERLRVEMPARDYANLLVEALRSELTTIGAFPLSDVRVDGTTGATDGAVLDVDAMYYMTPYFRDLRVVLQVRLTRPGAKEPEFSQRLIHDMPAEGIGYFSGPSEMAAAWARVDGARAAAHVETGLRELARMLAYELRHTPRFGRISGKQREWREGEFTTYGVAENQDGQRVWLRLRNGYLASVPAQTE